jgi:HD superfamily phosphodiesterase
MGFKPARPRAPQTYSTGRRGARRSATQETCPDPPQQQQKPAEKCGLSIALTPQRRTRDNAKFMPVQELNFSSLVEARYPGLMAKVRALIEDSETLYESRKKPSESLLWEHTLHVASIAYQLACIEGLDPLNPVIAALFHDAGKFAGGQYHRDNIIEEEESARIAEKLLNQAGMKAVDIREVLSGLKALYNEKASKSPIAAVIHDADFLSKFGALGIAAFFTKSTLRGRTLRSSLLSYLSKELTYAACLPLNMHTAAGHKMAAKKAADSLRFFRSLLAELREARIADLKIRHLRVQAEDNRTFKIQYVAAPACPACGFAWGMTWSTEKGIKCRKLNLDWSCKHCSERIETSFCLPEIV